MDSRSRTEYSILNIIAGVGGYIVNTILGFICRMVFVKCLAADYLGVNGLFTNILTNKIISSGPAKTIDYLELSIDNGAIISVDDLKKLKKILFIVNLNLT